jgi:hypothetical protein
MTTRKYRTEFCLNAYSSWGALISQGDFDHLKIPEDKNPQIYFIAKRPRITCKQDSLVVSGNRLEGTAIIHQIETEQEISFTAKIGEESNSFKCICEYPFTLFQLSKNNNPYFKIGISTLLTFQQNFPKEYLDLEILYIGQSFSGSDGYGIRQRLENHSTLQRIYAKVINDFPNYEVLLGVFHFEIDMITSIDGTVKETDTTDEEDNAHISEVLSSPVSEQQSVNFVEAGLIKYFEPEFNKTFKNSFPDSSHSSYASCYDLDFNQLNITLACDTINTFVYSAKVPRNFMHLAEFQLHSSEDRKAMFDVLYR